MDPLTAPDSLARTALTDEGSGRCDMLLNLMIDFFGASVNAWDYGPTPIVHTRSPHRSPRASGTQIDHNLVYQCLASLAGALKPRINVDHVLV